MLLEYDLLLEGHTNDKGKNRLNLIKMVSSFILCVLACMFVACVPRCPRDKKTALDPLELTGITDVS